MAGIDAKTKSTDLLGTTALPEPVDQTAEELRRDRRRRRELLREKKTKLRNGTTLDDAEQQELADLDAVLQRHLAIVFKRRPGKSDLKSLRQEKREAKQKSLYGIVEVLSKKQKKQLSRQAEKALNVVDGTNGHSQPGSGSWTFGNSTVIISNRAAATLDSCRVYTDRTASILPENQLVYFTDASGPPNESNPLFHGMSAVFKEHPMNTGWRILFFAAMDSVRPGIETFELMAVAQALKHAVEMTDTGVNGNRKMNLGWSADIETLICTPGVNDSRASRASATNITPNHDPTAKQDQDPSSTQSSDDNADLMTLLLEYLDLPEADPDHGEAVTMPRISEASRFKLVKIFTDSQSSLLCIRDYLQSLEGPCLYVRTCRINVALASIAINLQVLTKRGIPVEFRWVPGHSNVSGNKIADRASRAARHVVSHSSSFALGKNGKRLATAKVGVNSSFVIPIGMV